MITTAGACRELNQPIMSRFIIMIIQPVATCFYVIKQATIELEISTSLFPLNSTASADDVAFLLYIIETLISI